MQLLLQACCTTKNKNKIIFNYFYFIYLFIYVLFFNLTLVTKHQNCTVMNSKQEKQNCCPQPTLCHGLLCLGHLLFFLFKFLKKFKNSWLGVVNYIFIYCKFL